MTRTSAIAMLAAILMLAAPAVSRAQGGASARPPGTNSAGTAQSSGAASSRDSGMTTGSAGMGSGKAAISPSASPEAAIKRHHRPQAQEHLPRLLRAVAEN